MGHHPAPKTTKKKSKTKDKRGNCNAKYPILYFVGSIPIRAMNVVSIYIPEMNFVEVAKASIASKLSVAKVLAISGQPCDSCKNIFIRVVVGGVVMEIPRGLLHINKQNSGESIEKHKKRKPK